MSLTLNPPTERTHTSTVRPLLTIGTIAGPLFVVATGVGVLTRPGFDLRVLAISALSLGPWGWTQIATFIVSGLCAIAGAVGLRRVLHGRGATWGPLLVAAYGFGQVTAGIFVTDPALGFPVGAPAGRPSSLTWHATLHQGSAMLAIGSCVIACVVFAARWRSLGRPAHAALSAAVALAVVATMAVPDMNSFGLRLAVAVTCTSAWLAWTCRTVARTAA
jgi:Protein of unknown function (DUF998)